MSSSCSFVADLSGLSLIRKSGVQIVVVPRKLPESLFVAEETLASLGPFEIHASVPIESGRGAAARSRTGDPRSLFPELDGIAQLDGSPFVGALRRDVLELCRRFAHLAGLESVHVSLEVFDHDACRKWHADRVGMRLLVTYAGPGTEWALASGVDRSWLGKTAPDLEEANDRIVFDREAIRRAGVGDVLLCKGDLFEGEQGRGLVHRSPPIRLDSRWRLLLRIDERGCGE
ncbi:MAG: DUF1826 domain-containing protein [Myxococcota bacterium]